MLKLFLNVALDFALWKRFYLFFFCIHKQEYTLVRTLIE